MKRCDVTELVETYSDMVMRIAYQHCFNKSDSEDITQEVFIRLMDHISSLKNDRERIKAWLIRVTVNLCRDYNKSARYRMQTPLDEGAEEGFHWEDDEREFWDALKKLRPVYRTVLYMFYFEGYKIREIARILGMKENTVSSALRRARMELKDILTEGDDALWKKNIAVCSKK